MRPAAQKIWAIARELPSISDAQVRADRMAQLARLRSRTSTSGRIIFGFLAGAVVLMAIARYV
jgi:hypothetical protein